ncbi:unnamed protein product [Urochloa humidicola]
MSCSTRQRLRREELAANRASTSSSPTRRIPPEMADRCLNCLSYTHRIATCRLPRRCRRCLGFRHIAKDCRRSCSPTTGQQRPVFGAGGPQRGPLPQATVACRGGSTSAPRAAVTAAAGGSSRPAPTRFVRSDSPPTPTASQAPSRTPSPPPSSASPASSRGRRTASTDSPPAEAEPEPERCFVARNATIDAEEARLRYALIARVGNASRGFSVAGVQGAVMAATGLGAEALTVTPTFPESFLIICNSQDARGRVLDANPIPMANTTLSVRPWNRMVRANLKVLYHRVGLELDGIPEHAWDLDTARKLLAKHAWVERLDQVTVRKANMSTFKLTAWTRDPHGIPPTMVLSIEEPEPVIVYPDEDMQRIFSNLEPYLREKRVLDYPIMIHLRSIADFSPRSPSTEPSSPSDNGDSGPDGNPDRSYGFRRGVGPRLSGYPRRNSGDGGAGGGGGGSAGAEEEGTAYDGTRLGWAATQMSPKEAGATESHHDLAATQMPPREAGETETEAAAGQTKGWTVLQKHFPKANSNNGNKTTEASSTDNQELGDLSVGYRRTEDPATELSV